MSEDPYLCNDKLRSSTDPLVGWNDVPVVYQKEIFDRLGCLRKLGFQRWVKYRGTKFSTILSTSCCFHRVCHSWKSLLRVENWPDILLADEFLQLDLSIFSRKVDKARCNYRLESCQVYQEILRGVVKKSRVLIVNCARADGKSRIFKRQFRWLRGIIGGDLCSDLDVGNLEHLIVTRARMSHRAYFELFCYLWLDGEMKFSFISCNMVYVNQYPKKKYRLYSDGSEGILSRCFTRPTLAIPKELMFDRDAFWERPLPKLSFHSGTCEEDFCRELLLMFFKLIFPYTVTQLEWLETCLGTLQNQENQALSAEFDVYLCSFW